MDGGCWVPGDAIQSFSCRHIDIGGINIEFPVGFHLIEHGALQNNLNTFICHLTEPPLFFIFVFQQEVSCRQVWCVEIIQQPLSLRVYLLCFQFIPVENKLTAETQCVNGGFV